MARWRPESVDPYYYRFGLTSLASVISLLVLPRWLQPRAIPP